MVTRNCVAIGLLVTLSYQNIFAMSEFFKQLSSSMAHIPNTKDTSQEKNPTTKLTELSGEKFVESINNKTVDSRLWTKKNFSGSTEFITMVEQHHESISVKDKVAILSKLAKHYPERSTIFQLCKKYNVDTRTDCKKFIDSLSASIRSSNSSSSSITISSNNSSTNETPVNVLGLVTLALGLGEFIHAVECAAHHNDGVVHTYHNPFENIHWGAVGNLWDNGIWFNNNWGPSGESDSHHHHHVFDNWTNNSGFESSHHHHHHGGDNWSSGGGGYDGGSFGGGFDSGSSHHHGGF